MAAKPLFSLAANFRQTNDVLAYLNEEKRAEFLPPEGGKSLLCANYHCTSSSVPKGKPLQVNNW